MTTASHTLELALADAITKLREAPLVGDDDPAATVRILRLIATLLVELVLYLVGFESDAQIYARPLIENVDRLTTALDRSATDGDTECTCVYWGHRPTSSDHGRSGCMVELRDFRFCGCAKVSGLAWFQSRQERERIAAQAEHEWAVQRDRDHIVIAKVVRRLDLSDVS